MGLGKQIGQFRCQPCHFFFKRLSVVLLFLDADIASGRENVILLGNILQSGNSAESLHIFQWIAEENADLINCSGTLNGSGTTWTIDAECPSRWKVKTTQDAIRARYSLPGMTLILK